jgi:hypothetical protein
MANERKELTQEEYEQLVYVDGESLVVDLSNVEEMKFEQIPKGIYAAEVDQCDYNPASQSSGAPMLEFFMKITEGDFAGRKLKFFASFSPKALPGTKTALLRLDPELFNGAFKPEEVAASGSLLGKPIRIKVDHQDYQGNQVPRIAYILPAQEGASSGGFFSGNKAA